MHRNGKHMHRVLSNRDGPLGPALEAHQSLTGAVKPVVYLWGQVEVRQPATTGRTELGPGDCFAEVAYFTEVPKAEAVRSLTVCRVLVIPRR